MASVELEMELIKAAYAEGSKKALMDAGYPEDVATQESEKIAEEQFQQNTQK